MNAALATVQAVVFDIFGTVVDWRGSIVRDLSAWGTEQGVQADWERLADLWRGRYQPQMQRVRSGELPWTKLDDLHAESLRELLPELGLTGLSPAQRDHVNKVWHRLDPWPDAVPGLTRLKRRCTIGTLSNGNVALLVDLAKHGGLPWDVISSAELFRHYKPDPEAYLGACDLLALPPAEVMLCAAHNDDLRGARAAGLRTAFVARPAEYGPAHTKDRAPDSDWDLIAADLVDLARQMDA